MVDPSNLLFYNTFGTLSQISLEFIGFKKQMNNNNNNNNNNCKAF